MLSIAGFMAVVANRMVEGLVVPIFDKFKLDKFWLTYIAWAAGAALVALTKVNLFEAFVVDPTAGLILTALVAGGGANLLNDLVDDGLARKSK